MVRPAPSGFNGIAAVHLGPQNIEQYRVVDAECSHTACRMRVTLVQTRRISFQSPAIRSVGLFPPRPLLNAPNRRFAQAKSLPIQFVLTNMDEILPREDRKKLEVNAFGGTRWLLEQCAGRILLKSGGIRYSEGVLGSSFGARTTYAAHDTCRQCVGTS